jgi:hypothetical protein
MRKSVSTRRASKAGGSPKGRQSFTGGQASLDAPDLFTEQCGMEGYLEKRSTKGKWQKRYFVSRSLLQYWLYTADNRYHLLLCLYPGHKQYPPYLLPQKRI